MMKRLCYGSYLKVLKLCKLPSTTQKLLNGAILMSLYKKDITTDDLIASNLIACRREIPPEFRDCISGADLKSTAQYFDKNVIPLLDENKRSIIVLALRDIISSDDTIDKNTKIGESSKDTLIHRFDFAFPDFLASTFLYAVTVKNTDGKSCICEITKDYIATFESQKDSISIDSVTFSEPEELKKTIKDKNFDNVFVEVKHGSMLGLMNPNDLRLFHLNVRNNAFSFSGLQDFILRNIGYYVFSRARLEKFKEDDDLESIGLKAVRTLATSGEPDAKGAGHDLGEILIYAFLEHVLGAPKIMSKVELSSSRNSAYSKSEGVHLLSVGNGNGEPYYQMVFGASSIIGDLRDAIDKAFDKLVDIKNENDSRPQLIESTILQQSFDPDTTERIKRIIVPSRSSHINTDSAFGIFLGYSLGLNPADYSNVQFRDEMIRKMRCDIAENAEYISKKISALGMGAYSFYIYVLPFNDAATDKKSIMNNVITGGAVK